MKFRGITYGEIGRTLISLAFGAALYGTVFSDKEVVYEPSKTIVEHIPGPTQTEILCYMTDIPPVFYKTRTERELTKATSELFGLTHWDKYNELSSEPKYVFIHTDEGGVCNATNSKDYEKRSRNQALVSRNRADYHFKIRRDGCVRALVDIESQSNGVGHAIVWDPIDQMYVPNPDFRAINIALEHNVDSNGRAECKEITKEQHRSLGLLLTHMETLYDIRIVDDHQSVGAWFDHSQDKEPATRKAFAQHRRARRDSANKHFGIPVIGVLGRKRDSIENNLPSPLHYTELQPEILKYFVPMD